MCVPPRPSQASPRTSGWPLIQALRLTSHRRVRSRHCDRRVSPQCRTLVAIRTSGHLVVYRRRYSPVYLCYTAANSTLVPVFSPVRRCLDACHVRYPRPHQRFGEYDEDCAIPIVFTTFVTGAYPCCVFATSMPVCRCLHFRLLDAGVDPQGGHLRCRSIWLEVRGF